MKFERGKDIREAIHIGERSLSDYVHEFYMYGMMIMPSGSKPDIQFHIKDPLMIHKVLLLWERDLGLEQLDKLLDRYIKRVQFNDHIKMKISKEGVFRLCNPTIYHETEFENKYRISRTLRHYSQKYLQYGTRYYKMPKDVDRYVRFAADDFHWSKVE